VGTLPSWNQPRDGLDMARVRAWIHAGRKISLCYADEQSRRTERIIWPIAVGYHHNVRLLIAWCELRIGFRHFRADRVTSASFLDERYPDRPGALRARWRRELDLDKRAELSKPAPND
jgi:predicted DNA-binding transcriptional regulator YafY